MDYFIYLCLCYLLLCAASNDVITMTFMLKMSRRLNCIFNIEQRSQN